MWTAAKVLSPFIIIIIIIMTSYGGLSKEHKCQL